MRTHTHTYTHTHQHTPYKISGNILPNHYQFIIHIIHNYLNAGSCIV